MTAQTTSILTKADLATITLVCENAACETRVTVKPNARLLEKCPACGTVWDEPAKQAQVAFQNLCTALKQTKASIEFHVANLSS